ncbi:hypothetical protein Q8W71_17655 [Methylobacterium sp. NEAU 140]|uniref:hypothetical protein n=1 Tax=Methylobacterium sp. NEAU 140 TaxID=3064945 RepID=UPI00273661E2|nr:hypothetical protein [Methylobacterium sp. NEAU 140]MDP4024454.1 hypothetical protein [Methylobacterium sp. NEAU 140]
MIKAILTKPLDGLPEGTEREFDKGDFEALERMGAVRRAGEPRTDGPTVEEYVAAGYRAANYPPQGYASRSTPDEIAAAVAAQDAPPAPEGAGKAAPPVANKKAPSVANKAAQ